MATPRKKSSSSSATTIRPPIPDFAPGDSVFFLSMGGVACTAIVDRVDGDALWLVVTKPSGMQFHCYAHEGEGRGQYSRRKE